MTKQAPTRPLGPVTAEDDRIAIAILMFKDRYAEQLKLEQDMKGMENAYPPPKMPDELLQPLALGDAIEAPDKGGWTKGQLVDLLNDPRALKIRREVTHDRASSLRISYSALTKAQLDRVNSLLTIRKQYEAECDAFDSPYLAAERAWDNKVSEADAALKLMINTPPGTTKGLLAKLHMIRTANIMNDNSLELALEAGIAIMADIERLV